MSVTFQEEKIADAINEMSPLLVKHWRGIAHYPDILLEPDIQQYTKLNDLNAIKLYTARDGNRTLIGYAVYFIKHNIHYKSSLQAVQDVIYIDKEKRGTGFKFIKWCDDQLRSLGVQAVYHHVKKQHNFGPALERQGYELIDLIYGKRLDK